MHIIQSLLFVIGSAALGTCLFGGGLAWVGELLFARNDGVGGSGAGLLILLVVGSVVGALLGLAVGYRQIRGPGLLPWKGSIWIGIVFGIHFLLLCHLLFPHALLSDLIERWWGAAILLAAAGMLGGLGGWLFLHLNATVIPRPTRRANRKRRRQLNDVSV